MEFLTKEDQCGLLYALILRKDQRNAMIAHVIPTGTPRLIPDHAAPSSVRIPILNISSLSNIETNTPEKPAPIAASNETIAATRTSPLSSKSFPLSLAAKFTLRKTDPEREITAVTKPVALKSGSTWGAVALGSLNFWHTP